MTLTDRINRANAQSRRVPSLVFRLLLAWVLGAIVLALLVPALRARGVALEPWMVCGVISITLALAVGPQLVRRLTSRE